MYTKDHIWNGLAAVLIVSSNTWAMIVCTLSDTFSWRFIFSEVMENIVNVYLARKQVSRQTERRKAAIKKELIWRNKLINGIKFKYSDIFPISFF